MGETHRRPLGKIAYLTGEYPRATDTFIQREVAALRELGWDVQTCSIRRTGPDHHVGPEQVAEAAATFNVISQAKSPIRFLRAKFRALRTPGRLFRALALAWRTSPPGFRAHLFQMFYLAEAMVLTDELQRQGVTHLHNHIAKASCTVAMLTSELSGIPYSFTLHGPDIFFEPIHWRLDEKIARAQFVACISDFCRSQAMAFSASAHWDKLHIVHCGIEPERYEPRQHLKGQAHLLFVGRLAGVKGVPLLLSAIEELGDSVPGLRLTVVGDGPDRQVLEEQAKALGDRVSFVGYKSQAEVAALLAKSDALVLPSFAEGVPVVLMEAMAAGLPVITSRIAGIPELVKHGESGLLTAPGNLAQLTTALREILTEPETRQKMGQLGRARVLADFNSKEEAARLSSLIQTYATVPVQRPAIRPEAQT